MTTKTKRLCKFSKQTAMTHIQVVELSKVRIVNEINNIGMLGKRKNSRKTFETSVQEL